MKSTEKYYSKNAKHSLESLNFNQETQKYDKEAETSIG